MALTPQIDGNIISLEQTEKVLPSKTYKINNDVVSTEIEIEEGKPTVVESDELITIDDLSYEQISLNIKGNSWQEMREGRNKFNAKKIKYSNIKVNEDGSQITLPLVTEGIGYVDTATTLAELCPELKPNDYVFLCFERNLGLDYNTFIYFDVSKKTWHRNQTTTITQEDLNSRVIFYANRYVDGETEQCILKDFSVFFVSETNKNWEQYGAMPSPEFRSEIRNVGDNVNLYDKDNPNILNTPIDNNGLGVNAGDTYKTVYIECEPNQTYTISKKYDETKNRFTVAYTEEEPTYSMQVLGHTFVTTLSEVTIKTGATAKYLLAYVWINGGTTTYQEMLDSIKIEKGSKVTPYSPYNYGNANITICNENVFNSKAIPELSGTTYGAELRIDNDGVITVYDNVNPVGYLNTRRKLKDLCPILKVGDVAYLYLETTHTTKSLWVYGESVTWTSGHSKKITQAMLDDTIAIYGGNGKTDILKIMVTLDKLATQYIPHKSQTFLFPLSGGQKLFKDSYLADDGVHHKRGQHIVMTDTLITLDNGNKALVETLPNKKALLNNMLICSNAMFDKEKILLKEGTVYENQTNIVFVGNSTDTLETIKAKYDNSIVEYELAEEIIEPYTEEQQKVYNEINDILIESSVINIFSNDEIKPFVKVIYFSADNIIFNTGERDRIIGYADGLEAIKQAIYHILNTERYAYLIYDDNYGVEFEQYIGKDFNFIQATIEDTLREALTHDLRITDVMVNSIDKIDSNVVAINFTATTVYGDLVLGVNINV